MLFALVDDQRTPPSRGLKGTCPICDAAMIAKCGTQRIHHWAHQGERVCDPWWEETEWHRRWKLKFPGECREFIQCDALGERHIADVRTAHGLVLEFQHSHLRADERVARERFYKDFWWIVDGSRLKRDLSRFAIGTSSFRRLWQGVLHAAYVTAYPEEAFPASWLQCDVPVFFDFASTDNQPEDLSLLARSLWCLLPRRIFGEAVVFSLSRETFVQIALDEAQSSLPQAIRAKAEEILSLQQQARIRQLRAAGMALHRRAGWRQQGFRRRNARF